MRLLKRYYRLIAAIAFVALAATLAAYVLTPRRYTASASVWLDHRLGDAAPADAAGGPVPDALLWRNTELRFLVSPEVAARVVDRLNLAGVRGIGHAGPERPAPQDVLRQNAIFALVQGVKTRPREASYAIVASFTAQDPVLATAIVNQMVEQYVARRRGDHAEPLMEVHQQAEAARDDMIRAEAAADAFRAAAGIVDADSALDRLRRRIADLDRRIATAREQSRIGGTPPTSQRLYDIPGREPPAASDAPRIRQLHGRGRPAEQAVVVRAADATAQDGGQGGTGRIGVQLAALRAARSDAEVALGVNARLGQQRQELDAAAAAARGRYVSLRGRDDQVRSEQSGWAGAYVISRASVPQLPDWPGPGTFAAGGVLAALLAIAASIGLLELRVPGFRTQEAAERGSGLPVIGMVPDISQVFGARESGIQPIDLVLYHNQSRYGVAVKSILDALRHGRGGDSPRCIAVSSAVAGEGKTTMAVSLARSAALAGLRTLLIDCDLRRPAASQALAPAARVGLSEVLSGDARLDDALTHDALSGVRVLASRRTEGAIGGLLGSRAMSELVATLVREYDLVVLDTAPALALVESRTVAALADCVLLVARWRATPADAVRIAIDLFARAGASVTGMALTRVGA